MGFEGVPPDIKDAILRGDTHELALKGNRGGKKSAQLQRMTPEEKELYAKRRAIIKKRNVAAELQTAINNEKAFIQEQKNWKKGIHSEQANNHNMSFEGQQMQPKQTISPEAQEDVRLYEECTSREQFIASEITRLEKLYDMGTDEEGNSVTDLTDEQKTVRIRQTAVKYADSMNKMQQRMREKMQ